MEKNKKVKKTVSKKTKKKESIFKRLSNYFKGVRTEMKKTKNNTKKEKKVSVFTKIKDYFKGVRSEMKKTKWPSKKEMVLYSSATLLFILVFALFFTLNDVIISFVKQLVR